MILRVWKAIRLWIDSAESISLLQAQTEPKDRAVELRKRCVFLRFGPMNKKKKKKPTRCDVRNFKASYLNTYRVTSLALTRCEFRTMENSAVLRVVFFSLRKPPLVLCVFFFFNYIQCETEPNENQKHRVCSDLLRTQTNRCERALKQPFLAPLWLRVYGIFTVCEIPDTLLLIMNAQWRDFDLSCAPELNSSRHSSCNASSSWAPHDARF